MIPDLQIAARLGVTGTAVAYWREKKGIPTALRTKVVAWDEVALGSAPDAEIAAQLGVALWKVHTERRRRNIPSWRLQRRASWVSGKHPSAALPICWDAQPLGQLPDDELAHRLDVAPSRVQRERRARKIPPMVLDNLGEPIDWNRWRLGEVPDEDLAQLLGVPTSVVARARIIRGSPRADRARVAP